MNTENAVYQVVWAHQTNRATHPYDSSETLAVYVKALRQKSGKTLRYVELETEKQVSNAYLSQIESGFILHPSPRVLRALASALCAPYGRLMELAGHLTPDEAYALCAYTV